MKRWVGVILFGSVCSPAPALAQNGCDAVPKGDARWQQLDAQYAHIEHAKFAKDAKEMFSVYAPDFEAHSLNGQVTHFNESANYVTSGFEQVKENISMSNMFLELRSCGSSMLKVTVLQQWSRRQMSFGKLRLFQTATVQDETWILVQGEWKRKLADNIRPGAWLVDLKRVDPSKPYDPNAPAFESHGGNAAGAAERPELSGSEFHELGPGKQAYGRSGH